jgi:hypothetical protein
MWLQRLLRGGLVYSRHDRFEDAWYRGVCGCLCGQLRRGWFRDRNQPDGTDCAGNDHADNPNHADDPDNAAFNRQRDVAMDRLRLAVVRHAAVVSKSADRHAAG